MAEQAAGQAVFVAPAERGALDSPWGTIALPGKRLPVRPSVPGAASTCGWWRSGTGRGPAAVPAGAVTTCLPGNIGVPGGRDAHRRPGTASALRIPSAQPEEPRSP